MNSIFIVKCLYISKFCSNFARKICKAMKKFLLGFVILMLSIGLRAQGQFKDVRQTYLWDVTLSMKGYNGAPDIYDQVVDVMIKDIRSITDERTEIVVVPFQDTKYCEVWRESATPEGKEANPGCPRAPGPGQTASPLQRCSSTSYSLGGFACSDHCIVYHTRLLSAITSIWSLPIFDPLPTRTPSSPPISTPISRALATAPQNAGCFAPLIRVSLNNACRL